jgi:hypothetical protein
MAVFGSFSVAGAAAAAAFALAFAPDFGAVLRAVLAGALRVVFARVSEADPGAARFAAALRVEPGDFDEAEEVFRVAGFFRAELERDELDFIRLLGFFGVAMAADYSEGP